MARSYLVFRKDENLICIPSKLNVLDSLDSLTNCSMPFLILHIVDPRSVRSSNEYSCRSPTFLLRLVDSTSSLRRQSIKTSNLFVRSPRRPSYELYSRANVVFKLYRP